MKIELADATGRPEPQFVVYAESEQDQLFLKAFLTARDYSKDKLEFILHGYSVNNGKYSSFNFGWRAINHQDKNESDDTKQ